MTPDKGIEQAEVMRRWYEQQALPESERDIVESRLKPRGQWAATNAPVWDFLNREYRLRKRPKTHKATVYWYRCPDGTVTRTLSPSIFDFDVLIGTSTTEFTEPQE